MSAIDYTPVLLAQLTDLQMRVTKQDAMISALKAEIEKLSGRNINVTSTDTTVKTSIPLLPSGSNKYVKHMGRGENQYQGRESGMRDGIRGERRRPMVAKSDDGKGKELTIKDVLRDNEEVTIQIGIGKDSNGNFTNTTATAVFNGSELCVTKCDLVDSMVGVKSMKPGEILYKFIDELKKNDHIKRTFSIAPWKLCFVERDGNRISLEQLRSNSN
jgi:hypothetical protein